MQYLWFYMASKILGVLNSHRETEEREVLITMIKRKKRSLFRNDFFGIKDKLFMWRITNSIKKRNHLMGKLLESLLNITMSINVPITEKEAVKLEKVYESYQNLVSEIENDMKRMHEKIYDWRND